MTARQGLRVVLVIFLVVVLQSTLALDLRLGGAHPNVVYLLAIAAGLVAGPDQGAVVGFAAGLALDLLLPTPFGLSALVASVVGFGVGTLGSRESAEGAEQEGWRAVVVALFASAGAVIMYAVVGAILGQGQFLHASLAVIMVVVALVNAVLAVPAVRLIRWALDQPTRRSLLYGAGRSRW